MSRPVSLRGHRPSKYPRADAAPVRLQRAGREAALGPSHVETLGSFNDLGALYYMQGKLAEAEPLWVRALAGKEAALGPSHPDTLATVYSLGGLYQAQGKLAEAEAMFRRELDGCEAGWLRAAVPCRVGSNRVGMHPGTLTLHSLWLWPGWRILSCSGAN